MAPPNSGHDPESPVDPRSIVQNIDLAPTATVLSAIVLSIAGLIAVAILVIRHEHLPQEQATATLHREVKQ